jgi:hypothetical protein
MRTASNIQMRDRKVSALVHAARQFGSSGSAVRGRSSAVRGQSKNCLRNENQATKKDGGQGKSAFRSFYSDPELRTR